VEKHINNLEMPHDTIVRQQWGIGDLTPKPPNGGLRVRKELFAKIIKNVSKHMSLSPL